MADSFANDVPPLSSRRQHPRFEMNARVCLLRMDGSERTYEGTCVKVGIGGIGVQLDADFQVGEELVVHFPDTVTPSHSARVVYHRDNEYGLFFPEIV